MADHVSLVFSVSTDLRATKAQKIIMSHHEDV